MAATVVYVHGNGNKIAPDRLKGEWDRALFGRDMGTRSAMAYWASLRYPQPLPGPVTDENDEEPAAPLPGTESVGADSVDPLGLQAEARAEALLELGGAESVDEKAVELDDWLQRMAFQADALVEGEETEPLPPGLEALPLPRAVRVAIFRQLVKRTFTDVYAYFFGGYGEQMRDVVRRTLDAVDGPVVVVSHSLGTIIAYDVLREASAQERRVPLFVTAGSPLGVNEVQDLVRRPLHVPAGVEAWRNVCDARDLVALDHTIRPEYIPAERCSDFFVMNSSKNHHGIGEYLAAPAIRDVVRSLVE